MVPLTSRPRSHDFHALPSEKEKYILQYYILLVSNLNKIGNIEINLENYCDDDEEEEEEEESSVVSTDDLI